MSSSSGIAENATRVPVGEPTINAFDDVTATDAQAALDRAVEEQDVLDAREGMEDSGTTATVPTVAVVPLSVQESLPNPLVFSRKRRWRRWWLCSWILTI